MHEEHQLITKMFAKSGWPKSIIHKAIRNICNKFFAPKNTSEKDFENEKDIEQEEEKKWVPIFLTWCGKKAHQHMARIRQIMPREKCKITFAYKAQPLYLLFKKFSTCSSTDLKFQSNNLVYSYTCKCSQMYIGETSRRWSIRIEEHQKSKESAIYQHVQKFPQATTIERDKFKVVEKGLRHKNGRKKYESIFINFYEKQALPSGGQKTMNNCSASKCLVL